MNIENLFGIVYYAAHTAAGIFEQLLEMKILQMRQAGPWLWLVPVGCLALLALDLTGRLSLRGSGGKMLAALALPALCSCGEMLVWDDHIPEEATPGVWAWVFSLLLLAGYALLREEKGEENPLSKAENLLDRGSCLSVVSAIWLAAIGGAVLFMATFGLLLSLIVGGLIASRNGLLDYGGIKGMLAGLLCLYGLRTLWYSRTVRLVRKEAPELDTGALHIARFFPFWGGREARRLSRQLQLRGARDY